MATVSKPKCRYNPAQDQFAFEKCEDSLLLRGRLFAGDHSDGDNHVAAIVESDGQHRFSSYVLPRKRIASAASIHPMHADLPARLKCRVLATDEIEVGDALLKDAN